MNYHSIQNIICNASPMQTISTLAQRALKFITFINMSGQTPISLCDTFEGRDMVLVALRKIEYGEFA